MGRPPTYAQDALSKVSQEATPRGCLLWQGSTFHRGHGQVKFAGSKPLKAHRVAWAFGSRGDVHGALPPNHVKILHSCDVPACCNPEHLRAGTVADNNADRLARGGYKGKLSEADRDEARRLYAQGCLQANLAYQFGVDPSVISRLVNGKDRKDPTT